MASLRCNVCALGTDTDALPVGWRKLWIDCFGQLFVSADSQVGIATATDHVSFALIAVEEATACGQFHALALTERYLERGTFAPADHTQPELDLTIESDPFQALT